MLQSRSRSSSINRDGLKKGINAGDSRRKRLDVTVNLRKQAKFEQAMKRRMQNNANAKIANSENITSAANTQNPMSPAEANRKLTPAEVMERLKNINKLVEGVQSNDLQRNIACTLEFRRLLSVEDQPPIQQVINTGIVPKLVQFLSHPNQQLQFEAAWTLTNIASGSSNDTQVVVEAGGVPLFCRALQSNNPEVREQAVWALGNIAGDCSNYRDLVLKHGAMRGLLYILTHPSSKLTMLRNATWALSNLCRGKPQPDFEAVKPCIPVLARIISSNDTEILTDACWALSYISDDSGEENHKIQAVIDAGIAPRLVALLSHSMVNIQVPALRTVGNIITGNDTQTQTILNCGPLKGLLGLINKQKKSIRKEACWAISNFTAGTQDQIQEVISNNLIPPLVMLCREGEFDIQKEAAWALSNITSGGSDAQIRTLVGQAVIPALCGLFTCPDQRIIMVALEGVDNILKIGGKDALQYQGDNQYANFVEECGGLDALEELQNGENDDIYKKVVEILQTHFDSEEEDGSAAVADGGQQFSFGAAPAGDNAFALTPAAPVQAWGF